MVIGSGKLVVLLEEIDQTCDFGKKTVAFWKQKWCFFQ